ncbi:MAG: hypothetical protein COC01_01355 [Bacteroidetes bacterium]|nr:MAG: hypothetical protein COC01_01355 [Bacteroidota bacterium]
MPASKGLLKLFSIVFICFALSSCELINPDEAIPSYIHIDQIDLETTFSTEGSNTHKITDAWIYINNNPIGTFELPATIPIIQEGTHDLTIRAGIMENGIAATRKTYPFYDSYEVSHTFSPENIDTISLTINYLTNFQTAWKDDFEDAGISLELTSSSKLLQIDRVNNDSVFDNGKYAASFTLADSISSFECINNQELELPRGNMPVYLEMDYKNDHIFYVGIRAYYNGVETQKLKLALNETDSWNKVYINFAPEIGLSQDGSTYKIVFYGALTDSTETANILVDNLKLLHN